MFVGYEVESEEVCWLDATIEEPVMLSQVCLKTGGKEREPLVLLMRDKDQDKTAVICVLRCGITENVKLNLVVRKEFGFYLSRKTDAKVQLTGYKMVLETDDDDMDEDDNQVDKDDRPDPGEEGRKPAKKARRTSSDASAAGSAGSDVPKDRQNSAAGGNKPAGGKNKASGNDNADGPKKSAAAGKPDSGADTASASKAKTKEKGKSAQPATQDSEAGASKQEPSDADSRPGRTRVLPFGLKVQDILVGSGALARPGHNVSLHYTVRLENGKKVESTKGGRPFKFRLGVGQVIKGMDQGIRGMRVGGQRSLEIPPKLGYGPQGAGAIPGNAKIFFDVELKDAQ